MSRASSARRRSQHDPLSVVIADFQNNRPTIPRSTGRLEPMLQARARRRQIHQRLRPQPHRAAPLACVRPNSSTKRPRAKSRCKQGLSVILAGSMIAQGSGYTIAVKAAHRHGRSHGRCRVPTRDEQGRRRRSGDDTLMTTVRTALGDEASESDQMFAMASLSATSLDVVRPLRRGAGSIVEQPLRGSARKHSLKAVELDPKFGVGYTSLAACVAQSRPGRRKRRSISTKRSAISTA